MNIPLPMRYLLILPSPYIALPIICRLGAARMVDAFDTCPNYRCQVDDGPCQYDSYYEQFSRITAFSSSKALGLLCYLTMTGRPHSALEYASPATYEHLYHQQRQSCLTPCPLN
jgi:hypothetical protein